MNAEIADPQSKKLHETLTILLGRVEEHIRGIFDLKNHENSVQYKNLQRLIRILDEYKSKSSRLTHIGFLGHYNAGKSSAINAILDPPPEKRRQEGLDRTDTAITLITKSKNQNSILMMTRSGDVPIKVESIETEVLDSAVIIDTPGSGDPTISNELVRDVVPGCDLVMYFVASTNPLGEADIPLLIEQYKDLGFLPIKFVMTRADEFRIDENSRLTEKNFREDDAKAHAAKIIAKVKNLSGIALSIDDVFIIDSKAGFGVEGVKKFILDFSANNDPANPVRLHSQRMSLFSRKSDEIRNFFFQVAKGKERELALYVQNAMKNNEEYVKCVRISNNNMTNDWAKNLVKIQKLKTDFAKLISESKASLQLPENIWQVSDYENWKKEVVVLIKKESEYHAAKFAEELRNHFFESVKRNLDSFRARVRVYKFSSSDLFDDLVRVVASDDGRLIPLNWWSSEVKYKANGFLKKLEQILKSAKDIIKGNTSSYENRLNQKHPLRTLEGIGSESIGSLSQDVGDFFRTAEIYCAAVLSKQSKRFIDSLGLGSNLDEFDKELSTDSKNAYIAEAAEAIFGAYETDNERDEIAVVSIADSIRQVSKTAQAIETKLRDDGSPALILGDDGHAVVDSETREVLKDRYNRALRAKLEPVRDSALVAFLAADEEYNENVEQWLKTVASRVKGVFILLAAVVMTSGFVALSQFEIKGTFFWAAIASVAGAILFEGWKRVLSIAVYSIFADAEAGVFTARTARDKLLREEVDKLVSDLSIELKDLPIDHAPVAKQIEDELLKEFESFRESQPAKNGEAAFEKVREQSLKFSNVLDEYVSLTDTLTSRFSKYFDSPDENIVGLNKVSDKIKKDAIDPSFEHLKQMASDLVTAKNSVGESK